MSETHETDIESANRTIARLRRQLSLTSRHWAQAADAALERLPGASNSGHPAHSLWLRVQLHNQPPVEVVLS